MKIVAFIPYPISTPWFNTDLEVLQTHLDRGDEVVVLGCNGHLPACDFNPTHDLECCLRCVGRRVHGFSLLNGRVQFRPFLDLTPGQRRELAEVRTDFATLTELEDFHVDGFDVGWAVLASLVWLFRNPYPSLEEHRALVRDLVVSGLAVYRSFQNYLAAHKVDRVYLFNGKHAVLRGAMRACQDRGVECFAEEYGCNYRHYELFEGVLPHDIEYNVGRIRQFWADAAGDPQREALAARFYEERVEGVPQGWFSFILDQQRGLLPKGWDPAKRNVAVYTSSEDEFRGIGREWVGPLYENQLAGLRRIIESLSGGGHDLHLYIRIHPHLKKVRNPYEDAIRSLKTDFLTVIRPDEPVCTYTLMRAADKVLTFGSTMGIESVFWGKPSVLAGMSFFRDLGSTYNPASHEELIELLRSDLRPKDRTGALMFGYYYMKYGTPYRYLKPDDPWSARFNGEYVRPNKWFGRAAKALGMVPRFHRAVSLGSQALARRHLTGSFRPPARTASAGWGGPEPAAEKRVPLALIRPAPERENLETKQGA